MIDFISEADYARRMRDEVMPFLASRRRDETVPGWDGSPVHVACFAAEDAKGALLLSHGFTDSCEKFHELTYYFLRAGLDVFVPDHRGHGRSARAVDDLTLTHVDHFAEYVDDLDCVVDQLIDKSNPLFLFGHSMGGAIAALAMERHPDRFCKAVLSSPMLAPASAGLPAPLVRALFRVLCLCGQAKKRAFISSPYPGFETFEDGFKTSRERFDEYEALKSTTPHLQNYSPTCRWVFESLGVRRQILKKGAPERVETPVLLFSADGDPLVLREPQEEFIRRLPHGRFVAVANAKHELYGSEDAVLRPYLDEIFAFFGIG